MMHHPFKIIDSNYGFVKDINVNVENLSLIAFKNEIYKSTEIPSTDQIILIGKEHFQPLDSVFNENIQDEDNTIYIYDRRSIYDQASPKRADLQPKIIMEAPDELPGSSLAAFEDLISSLHPFPKIKEKIESIGRNLIINIERAKAYEKTSVLCHQSSSTCLQEQKIQVEAIDAAWSCILEKYRGDSKSFTAQMDQLATRQQQHLELLDTFDTKLEALRMMPQHPLVPITSVSFQSEREWAARCRASYEITQMNLEKLKLSFQEDELKLKDFENHTTAATATTPNRELVTVTAVNVTSTVSGIHFIGKDKKLLQSSEKFVNELSSNVNKQSKFVSQLNLHYQDYCQRIGAALVHFATRRSSNSSDVGAMDSKSVSESGSATNSVVSGSSEIEGRHIAAIVTDFQIVLESQVNLLTEMRGLAHASFTMKEQVAYNKTEMFRYMQERLRLGSELQSQIQPTMRTNLRNIKRWNKVDNKYFEHLESASKLAESYKLMLLEVIRRKAFEQRFMSRIEAAVESVESMRDEETKLRAKFMGTVAVHIPDTLIIDSLRVKPRYFSYKITEPQYLPDITREDLIALGLVTAEQIAAYCGDEERGGDVEDDNGSEITESTAGEVLVSEYSDNPAAPISGSGSGSGSNSIGESVELSSTLPAVSNTSMVVTSGISSDESSPQLEILRQQNETLSQEIRLLQNQLTAQQIAHEENKEQWQLQLQEVTKQLQTNIQEKEHLVGEYHNRSLEAESSQLSQIEILQSERNALRDQLVEAERKYRAAEEGAYALSEAFQQEFKSLFHVIERAGVGLESIYDLILNETKNRDNEDSNEESKLSDDGDDDAPSTSLWESNCLSSETASIEISKTLQRSMDVVIIFRKAYRRVLQELQDKAKEYEDSSGAQSLQIARLETQLQQSQQQLELQLQQQSQQEQELQEQRLRLQQVTDTVAVNMPYRISFQSFSVGDVVLFLPTKKAKVYLAFHKDCPHHYLAQESLEVFEARNNGVKSEWIIGRVVCKEEFIQPEAPHTNCLFKLAPGTKYYALTAEIIFDKN